MKKEFCYKCGTKKIIAEGIYYDEKTGKKNTYLICPLNSSVDCIHNHDYKDSPFYINSYDFKCTKCGKCGKKGDYGFW